MVERFLQLKSCARKPLIDLNSDIIFPKDEINTIKVVVSALQPIKFTIEALCTADCTLTNADVAIIFLLDELSSQNSNLSKELKSELIKRIEKRRTSISDVLQFLHNTSEFRNTITEDDNNLFNLNKSIVIKTIVALIVRVNKQNSENESNESFDDATDVIDITKLTMKERLHLAIKKENYVQHNETSKTTTPTNSKTLTKIVRKEIAVLEEEKTRGKYLTMAYNYLLTIKPTSVVFSSAGVICTKLRTNLSDKAVDTISLLRSYFNQQKELQI